MSESELSANVDSPIQQVTTPQETTVIPEKFGNDVGKLVESYKHLESKLGSMYAIPTPDSAPEKWQEFETKVASTGRFIPRPDSSKPELMEQFYNQLGRPAKPEEYQLDIPTENIVDQRFLQRLVKKAFDVGMTNKQLKDFTHEYMTVEQEKMQELYAGKATAEQQLKQAWGADYENRLAGAKAAVSMYKEKYPQAITELVSGPAGNNPAFIAMMSELGQALRETGHAGAVSTPQYGVSSDQAKDKIREIMDNRSHPYYNEADAGHAEAVNKVKKLYSLAYPE